jgi:hypothetical protein
MLCAGSGIFIFGVWFLYFCVIKVLSPMRFSCFLLLFCRGKWRLIFTSSSPMIKNKGVTGLGSIPFASFVVSLSNLKFSLTVCTVSSWGHKRVHRQSTSAQHSCMKTRANTGMKMKTFMITPRVFALHVGCEYIRVQKKAYSRCVCTSLSLTHGKPAVRCLR